jgi:CheY-like chemotaxis protein
MSYPTILLASADASTKRQVSSWFTRFGYEILTTGDPDEALTLIKANPQIGVLVADVESGGLLLAREARSFRLSLGVVYTSVAPHRVIEALKVPGAPIIRTPYAAHQLAGVIAGLGRRVIEDPLAA